MGYFDALTSSYFKTAQDGRKHYFPWGIWGRGYVVPTEADYNRLQRKMKTALIIWLVVIVATASLRHYMVALVAAALFIAFHAIWTRSLVRGLPPSDERLSWGESMGTQARAHGAGTLWALLIITLLLVAGGVFLLIVEPEAWLAALAVIVLFGVGAAVFVRMLMMQRAGSDTRP